MGPLARKTSTGPSWRCPTPWSWLSYPAGTRRVSGYAGDGGPAEEALFNRPDALAFDDAGNLYVSDRMNQVVRRIDRDNVVTTVAGVAEVEGYAGDGGPATEALLSAPANTEWEPANRIAVRDGRLVIADTGNGAVREVELQTGVIRTLADGFAWPFDVAIADDGSVVVADAGAGCVRRVHLDGSVSDVLGICGEPGPFVHDMPALATPLSRPVGVAIGPDGAVWVTDETDGVVVRITPEG